MLFGAKKRKEELSQEPSGNSRWQEMSRQARERGDSEAKWPIPQAHSLALQAQELDLDEAELEDFQDNIDAFTDEDVRVVSQSAANPATTRPTGLSSDEDLRQRFGNKVKSALGPGTTIEGKFGFDSPVRIDGSLTGEVSSTSALIVGEQAVIHGRITVGTLVVLGEVYGDVDAVDLVEIKSGGRLEGDIATYRIVIEDGALFEGGCSHRSKQES